MKGGKKRTSEPRRTANEEELANARVDPDHAAPAYDGHAVLQGEALVSEDEEEASLRKLRKRDQPSLVRLVVSLNVGALLCAFAYVAFQAPNNFAIGGASGFSIVLSTLVPVLPNDVSLWIVNVALVVVGLLLVERKAVFWSLVASVAIPAYTSVLQAVMPVTGSLTGDMWIDLCCTVLLIALGNAVAYFEHRAYLLKVGSCVYLFEFAFQYVGYLACFYHKIICLVILRAFVSVRFESKHRAASILRAR